MLEQKQLNPLDTKFLGCAIYLGPYRDQFKKKGLLKSRDKVQTVATFPTGCFESIFFKNSKAAEFKVIF